MKKAKKKEQGEKIQLLTKTILSIFRLNSEFLNGGNDLLKDRGLTSTDWQVMGAIALTILPMTAPAIADEMGMTRQGTQKRLNKLKEEGYVDHTPNRRHDRSPIWLLTDKGKSQFSNIMELYEVWMNNLLTDFVVSVEELALMVNLLENMETGLRAVDVRPDMIKMTD